MRKFFAILLIIVSFMTFWSCSENEPPVRTEFDIIGCWQGEDNHYMAFHDNNLLYNLRIVEGYGETIGDWSRDTYFYEPGYNIVIFIDKDYRLQVYQVMQLTEKTLKWCWVEDLRDSIDNMDSVGELIGQIIQDADHGFNINPEFIEEYSAITEEEFLDIIDSLDLMSPW